MGKQIKRSDGMRSAQNEDVAFIAERGGWSAIGGVDIGGEGNRMATVLSVSAALDFAAIQPAGSTGAAVLNVALTGVVPGDLCFAAPIASLPLSVVWAAACYSAGAVNIRAIHTQSGNIDMASGTGWRVGAIRFSN